MITSTQATSTNLLVSPRFRLCSAAKMPVCSGVCVSGSLEVRVVDGATIVFHHICEMETDVLLVRVRVVQLLNSVCRDFLLQCEAE